MANNDMIQRQKKIKERPARSIVKTISWRVTGTVDTIIISYVITGTLTFALTIGFVEVFTKMVLYFCHERLWDKSRFGRYEEHPPEYQI